MRCLVEGLRERQRPWPVSSVAGLSGASLHCPVPAQDSAQADALSAEGVGG